MSWLHSMRAQQVCPMLLLDQLLNLLADGERQDQLFEAPAGRDLKDRILARLSGGLFGCRWGGDADGVQRSLKTVRENVMIFPPLLRNDGLDRRAQSVAITGCAGAYN